jgi:DNA-binding NarL/FixJ family response regulator
VDTDARGGFERKRSMNAQPKLPVALVEDDVPFRGYIAALLDASDRWRVVLEASSVEAALRASVKAVPRVLLLDVDLPGNSGAASVGRFCAAWPGVCVVMLSGLDQDEVVLEAIREGASGYLRKDASSDEVLAAVEEAVEGGAPMSRAIARRVLTLVRTVPLGAEESAPGGGAGEGEKERKRDGEKGRKEVAAAMPLLTPREHEVVALVAEGLSDKQIAERLGTAVSTVKNHLANVYVKWRVRSRTEAAVKFSRQGR